jgi:hypothetical protein
MFAKHITLIFILTLAVSNLHFDNFVLDAFLTESTTTNTDKKLRKYFSKYFNFNPTNSDLSRLLDEILFTSLENCSTPYKGTGNDDQHLKSVNQKFSQLINKNKEKFFQSDNDLTDILDFETNFKQIMFDYFVYKFKIIAADVEESDSAEVDNIKLDDEKISSAVKSVAQELHDQDLVDLRIKELIDLKNKELATAVKLYKDMIKLRKESHLGIDDFLDKWLVSIATKETQTNDYTIDKIVTLLKAYVIINTNSDNSRLEFVANFGRNVLIKNKDLFSTNNLTNFLEEIWSRIFKLYAEEENSKAVLEGMKLWTSKFFHGDRTDLKKLNRCFLTEQIFVYDNNSVYMEPEKEKEAKRRMVIFVMDAFRCISRNDEIKKDNLVLVQNAKKAFNDYKLFLEFDSRNVYLLDAFDYLFKKAKSLDIFHQADLFMLFKKLYNLTLVMSEDYKNLNASRLTQDVANDLDHYLDLKRMFMDETKDFSFEIDKYYTVFKLYNVFLNVNIFENHGSNILAINREALKDEELGMELVAKDEIFKKFINHLKIKFNITGNKLSYFYGKELKSDLIAAYKQMNQYRILV